MTNYKDYIIPETKEELYCLIASQWRQEVVIITVTNRVTGTRLNLPVAQEKLIYGMTDKLFDTCMNDIRHTIDDLTSTDCTTTV